MVWLVSHILMVETIAATWTGAMLRLWPLRTSARHELSVNFLTEVLNGPEVRARNSSAFPEPVWSIKRGEMSRRPPYPRGQSWQA